MTDQHAADVVGLATAALDDIVMPDHDRLRAVGVLSIAMSAHEEDGRAGDLPEAETSRSLDVKSMR